jgi:four helix bundle protein
MATSFEDLRVLEEVEAIADTIWQRVADWEPFARRVVGEQLARAIDSIGANIAEAFGRFHYGEKLQFLYYARGSLFETKYWLNRALARKLIESNEAQDFASRLTHLARQLNAFANSLKAQRNEGAQKSKAVREATTDYTTATTSENLDKLVDETEFQWLETISNL